MRTQLNVEAQKRLIRGALNEIEQQLEYREDHSKPLNEEECSYIHAQAISIQAATEATLFSIGYNKEPTLNDFETGSMVGQAAAIIKLAAKTGNLETKQLANEWLERYTKEKVKLIS